jgi:hypothetical protein
MRKYECGSGSVECGKKESGGQNAELVIHGRERFKRKNEKIRLEYN